MVSRFLCFRFCGRKIRLISNLQNGLTVLPACDNFPLPHKDFQENLKETKMPSLQARTPMHGFHPLMFIGKCFSFSILIVLLCAGWVGVCYLKRELDNRHTLIKPTQVSSASASPSNISFTNVNAAATAETVKQNKASRLVYSCSIDQEHFHTAKHLALNCTRIALSETAARERGLKPCSICISQ